MPGNQTINFLQTNLLPTLVNDYLSLSEHTKILHDFIPDLDGLKNALDKRKFNFENRNLLYKSLIKQHEKTRHTKVHAQIELLKKENTYTVTTGHQLGIYTGPLFFIYKILQTIKLADVLSEKYPEINFVPVFWMASEDHDLAEIDHIYLYGKKLTWQHNGTGAAGKLKINTLIELIAEIKKICGENTYTDKLINIFDTCYDKNYTLAEGTRALVYELFADKGVVVIDGDDKELKKLLTPILLQEIDSSIIKQQVTKTNTYLEEKKYKIQVNPREYNFFYLQENYRERIIKENDFFYTNDKKFKWTKDELLNNICLNPEWFSPNVLMRPLYQETILPNIAYIGGAAEISYWLQLKNVFNTCNLNLPVLLVRNSFLLIDAATQKKIEKIGFEPLDFLKDYTELSLKYIEKKATVFFKLETEKKQIDVLFNKLKDKAQVFDSSLNTYLEAEKIKTLKFLENLEQKVKRAQKQKHESALNQIKNIKEKLFPDNALAERKENFIMYYAQTGNLFFETIYENINPVKAQLNVVYL